MNSTFNNENLFYNSQNFFTETSYYLINNPLRINDISEKTAFFSTSYKIPISILSTELHKTCLDKENKFTSFIETNSFRYFLDKQKFNNLYKDLDDLHKECEEEGYEVFDEIARANAKKILDFLSKEIPDLDYYIYSTEDREIAIDYTQGEGSGKGLLILCASDGTITYFKTYNGTNTSACLKKIDNIINFYEKLKEAFKQFEIKNPYITTNFEEDKKGIKSVWINLNLMSQSKI